MGFQFAHNNINVLDLQKSIDFYKDALGLVEVRRISNEDFIIVYLGDSHQSNHLLELTWLKERKEPYNLGDNEFHLAFTADDFNAAHESTRLWGASVMRTRPWASISFLIRTGIGWRFCLGRINVSSRNGLGW